MTPGSALSRPLVLLLAITCAQAVGTLFYAQPLLDSIGSSLGMSVASSGGLIAVTQIGYAAGLVLIVPLGDVVERRSLIISLLAVSALALTGAAVAPSQPMMMATLAVIGIAAVVIQLTVVHAASLAPPKQRGSVVGTVTSGVILGLVAARAMAGAIADIAHWRAVYLMSALTTILLLALLCRFLPAAGRGTTTYSAAVRSPPRLVTDVPALRSRGMLALLGFASLGIAWGALALYLTEPPWSLSHTAVGLIGLVGVGSSLAARLAGALADKGRGESTTAGALLLMTLCWVPLAVTEQSILLLLLGLLALDVAVQTTHVINQSLIYSARPEARSRLAGAYMLAYSVGTGSGSLAATTAYASHGWTAVCALGAAVSLTALGAQRYARTETRPRRLSGRSGSHEGSHREPVTGVRQPVCQIGQRHEGANRGHAAERSGELQACCGQDALGH